MTAKPRSAQYTAFHREMKTLAAAAAASAAAETAPPVACSIACQTEGGDQELALPVACPTEDSARDSASGEAGPPAKKAKKKTRQSQRLRAPEDIISELEDRIERMEAARWRLYKQRSRANGKSSKLEGNISKLEGELTKTEEEFGQKFKELNAEVLRYVAIARLKDVEADELAQQIKEMEKEVPNEMISDIEDELLHFTTIEGGRYTEQVRLLYYILCVTGSVSANAATKTLDALLTVLGFNFGKLPARSTVQTMRFEPLLLNDADTCDLLGKAANSSLGLSTDAGVAKGTDRQAQGLTHADSVGSAVKYRAVGIQTLPSGKSIDEHARPPREICAVEALAHSSGQADCGDVLWDCGHVNVVKVKQNTHICLIFATICLLGTRWTRGTTPFAAPIPQMATPTPTK